MHDQDESAASHSI